MQIIQSEQLNTPPFDAVTAPVPEYSEVASEVALIIDNGIVVLSISLGSSRLRVGYSTDVSPCGISYLFLFYLS